MDILSELAKVIEGEKGYFIEITFSPKELRVNLFTEDGSCKFPIVYDFLYEAPILDVKNIEFDKNTDDDEKYMAYEEIVIAKKIMDCISENENLITNLCNMFDSSTNKE